MTDELVPFVMCLDGEGDGMEGSDRQVRFGAKGPFLWGHFGDWKHLRAVGRGKDFTTNSGCVVTYGDGRGHYSTHHWVIGQHRG